MQPKSAPNSPSTPPTPAKRKPGRPPLLDGPGFDRSLVDRLLVLGELVPGPQGTPIRIYPSRNSVAKRVGVSLNTITRHWRLNDCERRRAQAATHMPAEQPVPDLGEAQGGDTCAPRPTMPIEQSRIADAGLVYFERMLRDGRLDPEAVALFERMVSSVLALQSTSTSPATGSRPGPRARHSTA